jgi:hypothetical protein
VLLQLLLQLVNGTVIVVALSSHPLAQRLPLRVTGTGTDASQSSSTSTDSGTGCETSGSGSSGNTGSTGGLTGSKVGLSSDGVVDDSLVSGSVIPSTDIGNDGRGDTGSTCTSGEVSSSVGRGLVVVVTETRADVGLLVLSVARRRVVVTRSQSGLDTGSVNITVTRPGTGPVSGQTRGGRVVVVVTRSVGSYSASIRFESGGTSVSSTDTLVTRGGVSGRSVVLVGSVGSGGTDGGSVRLSLVVTVRVVVGTGEARRSGKTVRSGKSSSGGSGGRVSRERRGGTSADLLDSWSEACRRCRKNVVDTYGGTQVQSIKSSSGVRNTFGRHCYSRFVLVVDVVVDVVVVVVAKRVRGSSRRYGDPLRVAVYIEMTHSPVWRLFVSHRTSTDTLFLRVIAQLPTMT